MMRVLFPDFCGPTTCARNRNLDLAIGLPRYFSILFPSTILLVRKG